MAGCARPDAEEQAGGPAPIIVDAFRLMLLTAQRRGEVLAMRWQDLSRDAAPNAERAWWWTIPADSTKSARSHRVPLNSEAARVLDRLRALAVSDTWVFPSPHQGKGPIANPVGDPQIPGFVLRVYPSGRRVFYVVYRVGRHRERLKLGIYTPPVFGLADARAAAKQALAKIIQGGNPAGARAEERHADDVRGLYEGFEREVVARFPARTQANWRGTSRRMLREVGDLPLTATDAICDRIMALHKRVGITEGKESLAKRIFQHAARLFRWAVEERRIKPSQYPLAGMRSRFQDKKRTRYYDPDEIRRLFEATDQATFLDRCFFRLLWYTGSRRGALAAMRWDEIRPDHTAPGEWLWYRQVSKNGDPLEVPLSAHAMTVIESLRPSAGNSAFVFPSRRADGLTGHRSDSSKPAQRLRGASGVADFTSHDIRRTISTYLTRTLDVPTDVVTAILNHRLPGPRANENYVQALPVKRMRAALEAWAQHLDGLTAR